MQLRLLLLIIFLSLASLLSAEESKYQFGRGIQVGELPLYVGGYFSIEYEHEFNKNRSLKLDDLAVMVYGEYNHFSYMLELEAEDLYSRIIGDEASEVAEDHFHIERLYLNYEFNENYALRVGKYNSPIGLWNRIPINVLRDTSSNPLITTLLFPKFTSGADLLYHTQSEYSVSVDFMLQAGEDIDKLINDDIYNNFDIDRHYGMGISLQNEQWTYQFNTGYFRMISGEPYYYLLGAFEYKHSEFKLQGEVGTQFNKEESTIPYVGYLQYSHTLQEHHEAIVRLESYHDQQSDTKDSFVVMGYTYRPLYPVAIKGEYQWHSLHNEEKFLLSISVLF